MACLSSKVSEVLRVFELQIGRDEISEVKSNNVDVGDFAGGI